MNDKATQDGMLERIYHTAITNVRTSDYRIARLIWHGKDIRFGS